MLHIYLSGPAGGTGGSGTKGYVQSSFPKSIEHLSQQVIRYLIWGLGFENMLFTSQIMEAAFVDYCACYNLKYTYTSMLLQNSSLHDRTLLVGCLKHFVFRINALLGLEQRSFLFCTAELFYYFVHKIYQAFCVPFTCSPCACVGFLQGFPGTFPPTVQTHSHCNWRY